MKKVAIVGGGVAGLTAGIFALKNGLSCDIYEKNAVMGGNLTGWDRGGCHIDNCIHWLNGTAENTRLHALWEEVGALGGVEVIRPAAFYTSEYDGRRLSLWRDAARTRREMILLSPADRREIDRFMDAVEAVAAGSKNLPQVWLRYGGMSLLTLSERFLHPLLRHFMTDLLTGAFSAVGLIVAYAAFINGNADVPRGGSAAMAQRMAARFEALGGGIYTDAAVQGAEIADGRVTALLLADGARVEADAFLFACDPTVTFGTLLPAGYMPAPLRRAYTNSTAYPVFSSVHAAFSVDSTAVEEGTVVLPCAPLTVMGRAHTRLPVRSFLHEPDFAPPGKTVIETLLFQDAAESDRWQQLKKTPEAYTEKKAALADGIAERIKARYPAAAEGLTLLDCWTPATYRQFFDSFHGAYMAFAVTGRRRIPTGCSPRIFGLSNALLATQWQKAPGGLPNAAAAGKRAAETVKILLA